MNPRLRHIVSHAAQRAPFYRELYAGIDLEHFRLEDLPTVDKRTLMDHFDDTVTDTRLQKTAIEAWLRSSPEPTRLFAGEYVMATTSATQGRRGVFACGRKEWSAGGSLARRSRRQRRLPASTWLASWLPGRRIRHAVLETASPFTVAGQVHAQRPLHLRLFHDRRRLDLAMPIHQLTAKLDAFQPQILSGYATVLEVLAREQDAGRLHIHPAEINAYAEILTEPARHRIQDAMQCKVFGTYGTTECLVMARECEHQRMHALEGVAVLEPVDEDLSPTAAGQLSHTCLVTSLLKVAQPIIRYDQGDALIPLEGECPCGSRSPAFRLEGRRNDLLWATNRSGRRAALPPQAILNLLEVLPGLDQFQLRQHTLERIDITYVPLDPSATAELGAALEGALAAHLRRHGLSGSVRATCADRIERPRDKKFRRSICTLPE